MYSKDRLAEILIATNCVRFGEFTLSSGAKSDVYVDMRRIISHPTEFMELVKISIEVVAKMKFDVLAGVESGGIPFATAIGLQLKKPIIYIRKESKDHGLRKLVEGEYRNGDIALVVDDVSTSGNSISRAIETLRSSNIVVNEAFVIVDREEGARERLRQLNVNLHYLITLREVLSTLHERTSGLQEVELGDEHKR
ncbi:MAG: orotate phosphoribosyltransferase [Nitrososphaerota archaeon]